MSVTMKKIGFLTLALTLFYGIGHAQTGKAFYNTPYKSRNSGSYGKSTGILTLSYGVPNESLSGYSHRGNNRIGFGPAYVKYEHGIVDEIGHAKMHGATARQFVIHLGCVTAKKILPRNPCGTADG